MAKGSDALAKQIARIARKHGVPVLERKPLTRALYKYVEVGKEIPSEFYQTVAEILAFLYRQKEWVVGRYASFLPTTNHPLPTLVRPYNRAATY